jgi:hypothetical protein
MLRNASIPRATIAMIGHAKPVEHQDAQINYLDHLDHLDETKDLPAKMIKRF